jgi:hypothetical protein
MSDIDTTNELPNVSESFGKEEETFPNASERLPKESVRVSETFRTSSMLSERTAYHTLPVRDVAKIFESASFPVTERTVINWCNVKRREIERLDWTMFPKASETFRTFRNRTRRSIHTLAQIGSDG